MISVNRKLAVIWVATLSSIWTKAKFHVRSIAAGRVYLRPCAIRRFGSVRSSRTDERPERFGHWNSVWKRFDRLSKAGVFEAFFDTLASMSASAHLIQMFDSTIMRAHVSAAGAKGGKRGKRSGARAAVSRRKSTRKPMPRERSSAST